MRVAWAICLMISIGVPAGASSPIEPVTVMPGKPSSPTVGSSDAAVRRVGLVTARTEHLPGHTQDADGNLSSDQVRDRRPRAPIWHLNDVGCCCEGFEQLTGEMLDRA